MRIDGGKRTETDAASAAAAAAAGHRRWLDAWLRRCQQLQGEVPIAGCGMAAALLPEPATVPEQPQASATRHASACAFEEPEAKKALQPRTAADAGAAAWQAHAEPLAPPPAVAARIACAAAAAATAATMVQTPGLQAEGAPAGRSADAPQHLPPPRPAGDWDADVAPDWVYRFNSWGGQHHVRISWGQPSVGPPTLRMLASDPLVQFWLDAQRESAARLGLGVEAHPPGLGSAASGRDTAR